MYRCKPVPAPTGTTGIRGIPAGLHRYGEPWGDVGVQPRPRQNPEGRRPSSKGPRWRRGSMLPLPRQHPGHPAAARQSFVSACFVARGGAAELRPPSAGSPTTSSKATLRWCGLAPPASCGAEGRLLPCFPPPPPVAPALARAEEAREAAVRAEPCSSSQHQSSRTLLLSGTGLSTSSIPRSYSHNSTPDRRLPILPAPTPDFVLTAAVATPRPRHRIRGWPLLATARSPPSAAPRGPNSPS
jgi:hypothetical protein